MEGNPLQLFCRMNPCEFKVKNRSNSFESCEREIRSACFFTLGINTSTTNKYVDHVYCVSVQKEKNEISKTN